jgi:DNA-binding response OmpR family regulator
MRTLLVEDDALLGEGVADGLVQAGFNVKHVSSGESAKVALLAEPMGLVVLDLGLPGMSGLDVLRWIRGQQMNIPVLILTARDTVADKVSGLDLGADDYLIKPFELAELLARARALVRRSEGASSPVIVHGRLELDTVAHRARFEGREVPLTGREFAILLELLRNVGRILSRSELEERLYGWGQEIESNAVEVHIHHLRRKFWRGLIRTVRGVGYTVRREDA